ncbi:succinate dehydrogenase, cytochrome b556 subunit [Beggiatoa leptomitoformis]|uniref:Succinate dehydrogenase cytochrome b556 subunit n=1 Tax=Beggiatoa leptomitoformis TaxID=288004 RepID=A0A2N9YA29_9GAMM|nr:succinate dehydrogenase, cytochrome b556 subunit [Beggiatoa leptomitoformis]ALG67260.1 succinate dehydrogenase, cytochrome b556 subunit [Beggiatoa leptomitoformis]AUI67317.1 succinate dehydrogenase, cytochrome b556 subunit [Beggiatoa leptomitoformis]
MPVHQRPLSPHLQIYKPQFTSFTSIVHRATGVFLSIGTIALVYWLSAIAGGQESYATAQGLIGSWIGLLLLFAWSVSLFYHLANGIRHLFWDMGHGLDIKTAEANGKLVLVMTVVLTGLAWLLAFIL